jgi:hypothetical protein
LVVKRRSGRKKELVDALKDQVYWAFHGQKEYNHTWEYVAEYITRKRLCKLGITGDINEVDWQVAEMFCIIDSELERLSELKRKHSQNRNRSRGK